MQTKATMITSTLLFAASSQAQIVANPAMPTLSSYAIVPEWERWSATSAVAAVSSVPVSVVSSSVATTTPVAVISTTTAPYSNPFTIYTSMTDSRGVITGMPSVVTSMPEVVTSQPSMPVVATVPAGVSTHANSTTLSTVTKSASGSSSLAASSASGSFAQGTTTRGVAQSTGGAASDRVTGASMLLVVLGFGFTLF